MSLVSMYDLSKTIILYYFLSFPLKLAKIADIYDTHGIAQRRKENLSWRMLQKKVVMPQTPTTQGGQPSTREAFELHADSRDALKSPEPEESKSSPLTEAFPVDPEEISFCEYDLYCAPEAIHSTNLVPPKTERLMQSPKATAHFAPQSHPSKPVMSHSASSFLASPQSQVHSQATSQTPTPTPSPNMRMTHSRSTPNFNFLSTLKVGTLEPDLLAEMTTSQPSTGTIPRFKNIVSSDDMPEAHLRRRGSLFERRGGLLGKGAINVEYSDLGTGDFRTPSFTVFGKLSYFSY